MKALTLLLGARSLQIAASARPHPSVPEGPFAPLATTPETARAWRMWAESAPTTGAALTSAPERGEIAAPRFPAVRRGSL